MAIADTLQELATDISSAYGKIDDKGGTLPANKNTNNLVNAIDSIPTGAVDERFKQRLTNTLTSVDDENITSLMTYALAYCTALASVNLPNLVTVGNYAFMQTSIVNLYLPNLKLASNNNWVFGYMRNMTFVHLPSTIYIPSSSFRYCNGLVTAVFDNATSINANDGFYEDTSLKNLILPKQASLQNAQSFSGTPFRNGTGGTLYTNYENVSWYQIATNWSSLESTTFTSIQENLIILQALGVDITPYYEIVTELPTTDISTTKVYLIETSTTGTYEQHYYNGTAWSTNLFNITL